MPGFNYNGEGATGTGLDRDPYVRDSNGAAIGVKPGYHEETFGTSSPVLGPDGAIQITAGIVAVSGNGVPPSGGSGGGSGSSNGSVGVMLVMNHGQLGYWQERTTGGGNNEHTTRVFIAVGPSEAEKAATAAKALQEKQQAEAAAKDFAGKTAAAAAATEKSRQQAVAAASAAGQHKSVASAQSELATATSEAQRLKSVSDAAFNTAKTTRQAAVNAIPAAAAAEKKYQDLLIRTKGMVLKNGQYGTEKWEVLKSNKEHDFYGNRFYPSGITKAQVDAAKADAQSKRSLANSLPAKATAAEQASLNASASYQAAETRRQAAQAALTAAQQAAAKAAEAERQRKAAEAAAAAAAEQKRKAEEAAKAAEAARKVAEQAKALQLRRAAADKLKSDNIQSVRGIPATAAPAAFPLAWSVTSSGGISLGSDVAAAVWSKISAASAGLRGLMAASMVGPFAATIAGLVFPSTAGDHSDSVVPGRDISALMPGDALGLPDATALNHAANAKTTVSMPVRGRMILRSDGTLETQLVRTPVAGNVPVVRGVLDADTGYWSYKLPAMQGVPDQTILVSPSDAPGVNGPLGITGPVPLPENIVHTGGQNLVPQGVTTTITPVADDLDFNDLILIFPPEALLKPLYVMLRSPRNMPGTVDGKGQPVGDNWLGGAGAGDGAPVPAQIADKLRGKTFSSFDSFRKAFWKEVAADPELSKQFHPDDIKLMKKGYSPTISAQDSVGKRVKMELHHKQQISKGGDVYNVDNLNALTPKRHIEIHKGE